MGDEVRRTQGGNNNAYCQDNETSWFDWTLVAKHADVHRFVSLLNARRLLRDVEHERRRTSLTEMIRTANKAWHGVKVDQPDWSEDSHSIAFTVELRREGMSVHIILNAYWEPLDFELPPAATREWAVAALDRHGARFAAGHRPLGLRAIASDPELPCRVAFGGSAVRSDGILRASTSIERRRQ